MSYRSEVAILLNDKAVKAMPAQIKEYFDNLFTKTEQENGDVLFHGNCLKWQAWQHNDVECIEDFLMHTLNPDNEEFYEFLRVGEGEEDVEHMTNNDDDDERLTTSTYIEFDCKAIK
ncbi:MAG: hypothetical protein IJU61_00200 [Victivallales bacterium]|nr:hypothetical protein [Victivallales bacterium]